MRKCVGICHASRNRSNTALHLPLPLGEVAPPLAVTERVSGQCPGPFRVPVRLLLLCEQKPLDRAVPGPSSCVSLGGSCYSSKNRSTTTLYLPLPLGEVAPPLAVTEREKYSPAAISCINDPPNPREKSQKKAVATGRSMSRKSPTLLAE